ncbi:MAG: hypothetical protein JOY70_03155, partial [Acidisphaera sp.]|nr:hypothetical protein [Acidisphaera sp.]
MADAIGTEWTRAGLALAGALALAALVTGAALADPAPAMRWGAHPGYERIVFDLPEGDDPAVEVRDDSVAIRFNGTARPTISSSWPHGVAAIQADDGRVAITLTAGVRVRQSHLPGRLVLDLLQPVRRNPASTPATPARPPGATGPTAAQPMPSTARGATVPSQTPPELPATTDQPSRKQTEPATSGEAVRAGQDTSLSQEHGSGTEGVPPAAAPQAQQAAILPATPSPEAAKGDLLAFLVAPKAADAEAQTATALDIPLGPQVGAAAFRRAAELLVVFDDRRPIDLSRVRQDPTFGPAQVQLLPSATLLRLPLSPDKQMHLVRRPGGWEIAAGNSAAPTKPLAEEFAGDTLTLSSKTANAVVALANDAGGTLLVGTQLSDGEDVVDDQRTPGFGLRPTLQGVVVDPTTDRLTVTATPSGFVVHLEAQELSPRGMDPGTVSLAADHTGSRRFDWTALPEAELRGRLKQAMAAVAAAPPQARLAPRIAAAEAMLALGLADQAEGALEAAVTDTPGAASNPDLLGLRAIAALLLDRPKEAASIDDPSLGSSDDVALWRALKVASENETSAQAAATIAAEWPLVQSYPAPLRERIASLALRTMAFGGRTKQVLQVLTTTPREPALQLARA